MTDPDSGIFHPVERFLGSRLFFWLCFVGFVVCYAMVLERLPYTIDEGVSVVYAKMVLAGKVPFLDFWYHQLPFQMFFLAGLVPLDPDSLFLFRLPSLLAVAGTGFVLWKILLRLVPAPAAGIGVFFYYSVPLQYHGLLAIPNGPMMLFSVSAVYLILFHDERWRVNLGVFCLVIAVLLKPVGLSTIAAIGCMLLLFQKHRWKLVPFVLIGGAGALASWGFLHLISKGMFTSLVQILLDPGFSEAIWNGWNVFPATSAEFRRWDIQSFWQWNALLHFVTFAEDGATPIAFLAIGGVLVMLARASNLSWETRILLILWLVFPVLFALFVWKPAFQSYHRQYLATFSISGAVLLWRLWSAQRLGGFWRAFVLTLMVLHLLLGVRNIQGKLVDYGPLRAMDFQQQPLFTLDPFINFLTRSQPACGLEDPMGSVTLSNGLAPIQKRFVEESRLIVVTSDMMIECLEESPDLQILFSTIRLFPALFMSEELHAYIRRQPEGRVIFPTRSDRDAFEAIFP